jgi:hypothetical protein
MTRWISAVKLSNLHAAPLLHERRVAREPEVDDAPPCARGGPHERRVLVGGVDLPDDVIAGAESLEDAVEIREAGAGGGGLRHASPVALFGRGGEPSPPKVE